MRYEKYRLLDGPRTRWLCKLFPATKVRFNVNQTCSSGSVFELSLPDLSVEEDYQLFTIDLYDHFLESACELARMAGQLRRISFVSEELESRSSRFFDLDIEPDLKNVMSDDTRIHLDMIRARANLVRAMKAIATIRKRTDDPVLLRLTEVLTDHLTEVMPELRRVQPWQPEERPFALEEQKYGAMVAVEV